MDPIEIQRDGKPKLTFWQIWNMCFGFLGIQFGFALQNANTSRIFETLGAEAKDLAIFWIAAPATGLIVQPIIGYLSDRTWHPRWGRRKPFFMTGAVIASIALAFMPNSPILWMAVGTFWIMDTSINISMEPFRAFIGDKLSVEQKTRGFAMQSFFIGVGAVVASALPWIFTNWIGVSNTANAGEIPPSVKWSYYVGAFTFISAVLWSVFTTKEDPPLNLQKSNEPEKLVILFSPLEYLARGLILLGIALGFGIWFYSYQLPTQLYVVCGIFTVFGLAYALSSILMWINKYHNGFVHIVRDFHNMPTTMIRLSFIQFFSWFALFSMWIYSNSAITSHIYGTNNPLSQRYNDGADWISFLFAMYNGVAAIYSLLIPKISKKLGRKYIHLLSLILGGLGLISIYFISNPIWLIASMIGIGIAWASILSIPYAMLSAALPAKKMGYYMGIFNFFIVIPQIIAASISGFLVTQFFNGEFIFALVLGGISMLLAGVLSLFVRDES